MRLDKTVSEQFINISREQAKSLILSGGVTVNGNAVTKPAYDVSGADSISIIGDICPFVSRGGLKLEGAINEFGIDIKGKLCADIGASAGGFTDCLLRHGAKQVYAVDVGHGQLDKSLVNDSRVINREGVNVRYLSDDFFADPPQFVSVDLSFISLKLILGVLYPLIDADAELAVLIKPQFEVGKASIGKNGIVKDKKAHIRLLDDMLVYFLSVGLEVKGVSVSSITGGDGNIEYLAYLKKSPCAKPFVLDAVSLVDKAFSLHKK